MTSDGQTSVPHGAVYVQLVVDAPPERVWRLWSDPDLLRRWWGPAGWTCPTAQVDFTPGGTTLVSMRSPEGFEIYNAWTYRTIDPPHRIEFDSRFATHTGAIVEPSDIGLPAEIPAVVPHVVTLETAEGGGTVLTVVESGYTPGPIRDMSQQGQEECLDKLAALAAYPG